MAWLRRWSLSCRIRFRLSAETLAVTSLLPNQARLIIRSPERGRDSREEIRGLTPPARRTLLGQRTLFLRFCLGIAVMVTAAGCGTATYEKRIEDSAALFSYLQGFEQNLEASTWQRQDLGLSMRTPKPFSAPLAAEGVNQLLDAPLPGVIEAWAATLGNSPTPNAFLYVLGNHSIIEARGVGDASQGFHKDVESVLSKAFGVTIPPDEVQRPVDNSRFRHQTPKPGSPGATYTNSKDYVSIVYAGSAGRASEAQVYLRKEGNTLVAVVLVLAERSTPQMRQRMDLALQTFEVQELKIRPQGGAGGQGRGQPAGAGTGGF